MTRELTASSSTMAPRFTLPNYEGPLDLLLQLIRESEVDIYDIPIAEITRQYLERLAEWHALDLTVAGEYLVMAATLLEIKSRMLLPKPPQTDDEPDPRAELVAKLLEYRRYQGVVEQLREWENYRAQLFFRDALETVDDYVLPVTASELTGADLASALRRVLEAAGVQQSEPVSAIVPQQRVSLRMKMAELLRSARRSPSGVSFQDMSAKCAGLTEIVICFLALLELVRTGKVRVYQRHAFGDIRIHYVPPTDNASEATVGDDVG